MNCCSTVSNHAHSPTHARMTADGISAPSSRVRRSSLAFTRLSLPALVLVFLPKCPACLAAYLALGTGVSLSVTTSAYLRMMLMLICIAAIIFNVLWLIRKLSILRSAV
jgi:hypothetical protein